MDEAKMAVFMVKGMIAEAPEAERNAVNAAADKIRTVIQAVIAEYGDHGRLAASLVAVEMAAEG